MIIENGVLLKIDKTDIHDGVLTIPDGVTVIADGACVDNGYSSSFLHLIETVILPEGIETIEDNVFKDCRNLDKINFPKSLTKIGSSAFLRTSIASVNLSNVKEIGERAFEDCVLLSQVKLGESLTHISDFTFALCNNLKSISFPKNLKSIGKGAFNNCGQLEFITLPKSLEKIDDGAFSNCVHLYSTKLPQSLKYIGLRAFYDCEFITKVTIPSSVEYLGDRAFHSCERLKKVKIEGHIKELRNQMFLNCKNLSSVTLPEGVQNIGDSAFWFCSNLKKIVLPKSVTKISEEAFYGCSKLKNINLHNNITSIGAEAFLNTALVEVELPEKLTVLNRSVFSNCRSLEKVVIPDGVTKIKDNAFYGCCNLTDVKFPENLETIESHAFSESGIIEVNLSEKTVNINDAFQKCSSLLRLYLPGVTQIGRFAFADSLYIEKIFMPKAEIIQDDRFCLNDSLQELIIPFDCKTEMFLNMKYVAKEDDYLHISKNPFLGSVDLGKLKGLRVDVLALLWDKPKKYIDECSNRNVLNLYNFLRRNLFICELEEFIEYKNLKIFKQFDFTKGTPIVKINRDAFCKLYYNLGGFLPPITQEGVTKSGNSFVKKVDYAQKVGEFLKEVMKNGQLNMDFMHTMFGDMKLDGIKQGFTDFFLDKNNFNELMVEENINSGFISKCYNYFEKFQQTNTSNRGSQRQLKPTVEKLKNYFYRSAFENITPENQHIAETLFGHFNQQVVFDRALSIDAERKINQTPNNILSSPLKENDVFQEIERLRQEIDLQNANTLGILTELANKNYTFEWLERNDPTNFILGKLCSCCSHIEGIGYGIMRASIIHPDVQNLVIKDRAGRIIAKSTLYLNRQEGYGVFNNVEVNTNITSDEKKDIYDKYITAVRIFAQRYNKENPDNPLKQINVGMKNNDLDLLIAEWSMKSDSILKAMDYSVYGIFGKMHSGDSQSEQCILWKEDEI